MSAGKTEGGMCLVDLLLFWDALITQARVVLMINH